MKLKEIVTALEGVIVCGAEQSETEVLYGFASDLMSDVLTLKDFDHVLMITGLCNMQTIRTAEMSDINHIVFVRGKKVTEEMLELAQENNMVLIECSYSMFRTCGIVSALGLPPIY